LGTYQRYVRDISIPMWDASLMIMARKTESEVLFELFCNNNGIAFDSIPTKSKEEEATPDYDIYINGQKVVVEIKQIDPNPEEIIQQKNFEAGGVAIGGGTPGARARSKITAGANQIKIRAKGNYPSILVLYNNVPLTDHTDPYFIRVAMYGLETHVLGVPKEMSKSPYLIDKKFGPKRKMTKDNNTSISAVAVLAKDVEGIPKLFIFHNIYAEIQLVPELFRSYGVRQFTLGEKVIGQFQDWKEI
jgi:hypothetical protein